MTNPKSTLRIGWFIPWHRTLKDYDRVLASVWIRCLELIGPLQELGYKSTINQPWAPMDIAIFVRLQGPWAQRLQRFLQLRRVKTIYSAIVNYYQYEGNMPTSSYAMSRQQIDNCIAMTIQANAVLTASRHILAQAQKYNPNAAYVPDSVGEKHFCLTKPVSDFERSPINLIWAGHASKAHFIDQVMASLQQLPVKLTVLAEHPPDLKTPFKFVRWRYETFPGEIIKGDICISPRVLDNSYDLGHSNFKIMVFLAQGVPALVSPQDSYVEVVRNGFNGYVCQTTEDWVTYLQAMLQDRSQLAEMSRNAIESAQPYLTETVLAHYDALFQRIAAGQPVVQGEYPTG